MTESNGIFIVIEGSDGSGKGTQFKLLKERLQAVGYEVASFDFPRYDAGSSYFVKKYLNGEYGPAGKVSAYAASLFYALDRYEAAGDIKQALKDGKIALANRFAGSNMAHQGAKFNDEVERRSFFVWADNLEFQLLGIPRPNVNFYLRVPAEVSYELIGQKAARSYTSSKRDEHEADISHLRKAVATFDLLCRLFPKDFMAIECTKKGEMLSVPEINNLIWEKLKPLLPGKKAHASRSVVVTLGEDKADKPAAESDDGTLQHEFKDASLMLRLHLQRQAPDAVSFDFDGWQAGNYRFYSPSRLSKPEREQFKETAEQLSILHQQLAQKMAKYFERPGKKPAYSVAQLLQPLIPLGALSNFKLNLKKRDIRRVAGSLLAGDSEELQWAAKQLYLAARGKWPRDFEQPLESADGPTALNNIIAKMALGGLPQVLSGDESIKLLEARPRLEFELLAESIYPYSNHSLDEISEEVSDWPYSQKYESLKEAAGQSEILRKAVYKLDILSDQLTLDKIIQTAHLNNIQAQSPSPRYGYEMPRLIDEAAADDLYDSVFDESLKFYSFFQAAGRDDLAPYATLLGHKLRWQMNASAADLRPVFTDPALMKSPTVKTIAEKLVEVHPILWEIITEGQAQAPVPERKGKARVKQAHRRSRKPKKS